jgi:hypothetical protein
LVFLTLTALLIAGHSLALTFTLALTFAGLRGAELALHALRHLPPAFRQSTDRLLLCASRVPPFGKRFRRITHGAIRLTQGGWHITGQFAHLLHQFT